MPPLMQLPGYQYPKNALLNFQPVSDAIDSNRQNALMNRRADMEQERVGMERKRLGMAEQSHASEQQEAVRKRMGGMALLALQGDEAKQAEIHQQLLASHPNAAGLQAHYRDPKTGLLAIVGDAGMADDYLRFQLQKEQAARAAAAEGRAASMHPLQMQEAQLSIDAKQRELDNPKADFKTIHEGDTAVAWNPRSKQYDVIAQGSQKPPAEHIGKAANFSTRMVEAERNVRALLNGEDPITKAPGAKFPATDADIAVTNAMPELARNLVISGDQQRYRQGAEMWIRAFLRKESGAAISSDEFRRDFVVYFPQPGDKPEVVRQKEQARLDVMKGMAAEAGTYMTKTNPEAYQHLQRYLGDAASSQRAPSKTITHEESQTLPVVSPEDAARLPVGTYYRTTDGRVLMR